MKIFAYILSKIKPTDKESQEYTFYIKEYCQICAIDYKNGANYRYIKKSLKNLRDKSFWLADENGKETLVGWLAKAKIDKGSGKISVKLDEDLQKYVLGLFENYTQYSLLSTLPMKSSYSFRLYELLQSFSIAQKQEHIFEIDELKTRLGADVYKNFKDFRLKVLEIGIKEINLYTDLEVSWEPINQGRKVVQVKFVIKKRDGWGQLEANIRANDQLEGQISIFDYDYYNEL